MEKRQYFPIDLIDLIDHIIALLQLRWNFIIVLMINEENKYTILKLIQVLHYISWKKREQSYFHIVHSIFIMSNTQDKIIFYDPTTGQFNRHGHAKFHELFKQYRYPSVEKIQELSEETGAPFSKCKVRNTGSIDLS